MDLFNDILEKKEFEFDGAKIELVRPDSSPGFAKKSKEAAGLEDEAKEKAMRKAIADELISGFSGLEYQGKPIKFNKKNCRKLMEHTKFRTFVVSTLFNGDFSGEREIDLELEEAEKN